MSEGATKSSVSVHWFRRCLRVHDNVALIEATKHSDYVIPLYVLDTTDTRTSVRKQEFLLDSLRDLDKTLRERYETQLFFARGDPRVIVPNFVKRWKAQKVTFEKVSEPHLLKQDTMIITKLDQLGVEVKTFTLHTLFDLGKLGDLCNKNPPLIFKDFSKLLDEAGPVERYLVAPSSIPPAPEGIREMMDDAPSTSMWKGDVPTLTCLGVKPPPSSNSFQGGESVALLRLEKILCSEEPVKSDTTTNPFDPSSTVLSPYLNLGCLSVRKFYHDVTDMLEATEQGKKPFVSIEGQLLWREFYYLVGAYTPNFDKMKGNKICKQIPWRTRELDPAFDEDLLAWAEGQTGYPFIDAIMVQLKTTGWIHHLARHAVACFLSRGDLWISWEEGAKVFERLLLDGDWSLNTGNWLWLSASCFFYQYYRVYSPVRFGNMTDKTGNYVRRWIPALKDMPDEYIYEPWKAPIDVQRKANCIVGKDYPERIIDHEEAKERNVARMRMAYKSNEAREELDNSVGSGVSGLSSSDARDTVADSTDSLQDGSSIYSSDCESNIIDQTKMDVRTTSPRTGGEKRKRT